MKTTKLLSIWDWKPLTSNSSQRVWFRVRVYSQGGEDPFRQGGKDPFRQGGKDPFRQGGKDPFRQGGKDPFRQGGENPFRQGGKDDVTFLVPDGEGAMMKMM